MDTQKGMTIKKIAKIINVGESTIRRWITSANLPDLSAKLADAKESKVPAMCTLNEILTVLRGVGKNTLADLLEANAADQMQTQSTTSLETVTNTIIPAAIIGRIYLLFCNSKNMEMSVINRIMEYAATRSLLTGKYLSAKDITLLLGDDCNYSENYISKKINAIRKIMEEAKLSGSFRGFLPAPGIDMIELEEQHV